VRACDWPMVVAAAAAESVCLTRPYRMAAAASVCGSREKGRESATAGACGLMQGSIGKWRTLVFKCRCDSIRNGRSNKADEAGADE
jgi:hypothetical protein